MPSSEGMEKYREQFVWTTSPGYLDKSQSLARLHVFPWHEGPKYGLWDLNRNSLPHYVLRRLTNSDSGLVGKD